MELRWDNLGQWPQKVKIKIFIVWLILSAILGYLLFLNSPLQKNSRTQNKIQVLAQQLTDQKRMLNELMQQPASAAELPTSDHAANALYIDPQQLSHWLGFFAQLAQQNQLTLQTSNILMPIQANFYQELPIHLRLIGTYQNITYFLTQLTNLAPLFLIAEFSLEPKNHENPSAQLLLDLHLHAFAANHKNSVTSSETFITPTIKQLNLTLRLDPFSRTLIQPVLNISNLKMLGSILSPTKHWALLQNGHTILHVTVGQQLDEDTQVTAITQQAVIITQNTNSSELHTPARSWQIPLIEKTP